MQKGLYNVDASTKTATDSTTWIQAGIHENLKLVDVKCALSKNNNLYLAFYAENEQGDKVSNTEWEYTPKKEWSQMTPEEQDKSIGIIENQKAKVKQIVEIFKPDFNIDAETFEDFAKKTVEFLGDSYKDKLFRLKVVYDYKGFTTFAQSARYVFIESMDIAKEDSQIRILGNDKIVREGKIDKPSTEKNPVLDIEDDITPVGTTTTAVASDSDDEAPF
jgi:hypothetical protein